MPDSSGRAPVCANCGDPLHQNATHGPDGGYCGNLRCSRWGLPQVATPSGASAPPRTEAPEPRRSAYAFPIHACERCWHGESELTIHNKVMTACPKCGGTMREVGIPVTDAPQPCDLLCLVCARVKPWGIWDQTSGIAVCVECRDKARKPSPSTGEPT